MNDYFLTHLTTATIITVLAFLTAYSSVRLAKLMDLLFDYKMIFWKVRYNLAMKAAKKVDDEGLHKYSYVERLEATKKAADEKAFDSSDETSAMVMDRIYQGLAQYSFKLKALTCVYCLAIRYNVYLSTIVALILFSFIGWWVIAYLLLTGVFVSKVLDL